MSQQPTTNRENKRKIHDPMGIQVMAEVWQHVPVSGGDLLVLLRLADSAGEDHRMTWESVSTLAKKTAMTERNVYRCLKNLTDAGILELAPEEDWPRAAHLYPTVVRRVTEPHLWPQNSTQDDNLSGGDTRSEVATTGDDTVSGGDDASVTQPPTRPTTSRGSLTDTSYLFSNARRRPGKETKSSLAKKAQAREDDIDPAKNLEDLQDAPDATETDERAVPAPREPRTRKRRSVSPAANLARSFKIAARMADQAVPGATNDEALRGSITKWLAEGITQDQIRSMIETYWSPTFQRAEHVPAWQDFLAQRGNLAATGKKHVQQKETEEDRYDAAKWGG